MHARMWLILCREDVAIMFAQIAAGIGRDPALHAGDGVQSTLRTTMQGMGGGDILYPSNGSFAGGRPFLHACLR